MEITKTQKIFIGAVVVMVLVFGFYLVKRERSIDKVIESDMSTTTNTAIKLSTNGNDSYTVTQVPIENNKPVSVPDLDRKVIFGTDISLTEEVKKIVTEKITGLQTELKKDKTNLNNWLDLGLYQKMAGDYNGAIITWKYVGNVANKDYVSFGNLGNLYGYYLHDNGMAEMYYKKAIENGPTQSYLYVQLAMFYVDVFKDMSKAQAILDQGLKKIPGDKSLLETKDNLEK